MQQQNLTADGSWANLDIDGVRVVQVGDACCGHGVVLKSESEMLHTEFVKRSRERSAMELAIREAKARLSELVAAARSGERVIITKHGRPAVELVRCDHGGGIDFEKLEAARRRLGMEGDRERWPSEYDDPAFSRRVLGLDIE